MVVTLPIELQDKIFLSMSFDDLEKSRDLQSEYVKRMTQFDNYNDASKAHNLDNMKWLYYQRGLDLDWSPFYIAVAYGNLEIVKWVYSVEYFFDKQLFYIATGNKDIEVIKWLYYKIKFDLNSKVFSYALRYENLEVLKWLHSLNCEVFNEIENFPGSFVVDNGFNTQPENIVLAAAYLGNLEILKWVIQTYADPNDKIIHPKLFEYAIFGDNEKNLSIVEWVWDNYPREFDKIVYQRTAASRNQLKLLKWMHSKFGLDTTDSRTLYNSLNEDNLEMVNWLMDLGFYIESGIVFPYYGKSLEIFKILHENGITFRKDILNSGTVVNSLEIAKWFYELGYKPDNNTPARCIRGNQLETLKWVLSLKETTKFSFDVYEALLQASYRNNFEIVKWLYENYNYDYKAKLSSKILTDFIEVGNLEAVKWARPRCKEFKNVVQLTVNLPESFEILEYFSKTKFRKLINPSIHMISGKILDISNVIKIHKLGYDISAFIEVNWCSFSFRDSKTLYEIHPYFNYHTFIHCLINKASLKKLKWMIEMGCRYNVEQVLSATSDPEVLKLIGM